MFLLWFPILTRLASRCPFPERCVTIGHILLLVAALPTLFCGSSQHFDKDAPYAHVGEAEWIKNITRRKDKVTLTCPPGHVIYGPRFEVGVRAGQNEAATRRVPSPGDCRGLGHVAQTQLNKCYWQHSCKLTWRERMPIVTSSNPSCIGVIPDYVIFNNPPCIPLDNIVTMCEDDDVIDLDFGVVRSHDHYPWRISRQNKSFVCRKTLATKPDQTLVIYLDDHRASIMDVLTIYHVSASGTRVLGNNVNKNDVKFSVTSGRIIIDYVMRAVGNNNSRASGFVLRFEQKSCNYQPDDLAVGEMAEKVASFGLTRFKVRAAISQCVYSEEEQVTLACPKNHVIFQPDVRHGITGGSGGGSSWGLQPLQRHRQQKRGCHGEEGDCRGLTHTLVVQQNQCHWRPECNLSWRSRVPILVSDEMTCVARMPDYVEMAGARCLPEDSIHDICDRGYWTINTTHGYVRSHADYPWNYESSPLVCRKRICAHRKFGLRIFSDNLDLSLNKKNSDHVKVWHVTEANERHLVRVYRQRDRVELCFNSGCVDVEFKKRLESNRGRGFVLRIGTARPVIDDSKDFYQCGSLKEAVQKHAQLQAERRLLEESSKVITNDHSDTL